MANYRCEECNEVFDDFQASYETDSEEVYDSFLRKVVTNEFKRMVCPTCGNPELSAATPCAICGEYKPLTEGVCDDCIVDGASPNGI